MADLGNQKIKDTYQLVLQTDASGNLQNLTGGTPSSFIVNSDVSIDGNISATTANLANISIEDQYLKANGGNRIWLASSPNTVPSYLIDDWKMADNDHLYFGNGEDLDIYHNGSNSYIDNDTGNLNITSGNIYLGDTTSTVYVQDNFRVNDFASLEGARIGSTNTDPGIGNLYVENTLSVASHKFYADKTNGVGIGTANPTHELTVSGTSSFVAYIMPAESYLETGDGSTRVIFANGATTSALSVGNIIRILHEDTGAVLDEWSVTSITNSTTLYVDSNSVNGPIVPAQVQYDGGASTKELFVVYNGTGTTFQITGDTVMSGSTDLLDMFANSGVTNQDVYWSASTGGISNSGLTGNVGIGTTTPNEKLTVSGAISGDSTMVATTYNSTTSSAGYKLNGGKYLWLSSSDLQVGNVVADTDIIGTSINLQTATTISDNLTVTDKVLIGTGAAATHDLDVITGSNVGIRAKTTSNSNAQLILMNTQATWSLNNKTGTADVIFGTGDGAGDFVIESDVIITGDTKVTGTTISTGGFVGALTGDRKFTISTATDKNLAQGDIIYFGGGSTIEGDLVIITSAGTWTSAQANAVTSGTSMLGIALGTDPDVDGVLLKGTYTLDHDVGNVQGAPLYLSDTTVGQATATVPASSGDIVRIVGYNLGDADEIWFDPDKTWVELS